MNAGVSSLVVLLPPPPFPQSALPVLDNPLSVRVRRIVELLNQERNTLMKVSTDVEFERGLPN